MRDTAFKFKTNKNTKSDHHPEKHHSHCHHQHHKHHHNSELNYYPHHSDDDYQHHHHNSESNHHHHHHHNLDSNHNHHHNNHSPHYYKEGPQYTAPYINSNQLPSPQTLINPINVPISQPVYNHQYYGTKPQELLSNNTNSVTNHEDQKSPTYYAHYHDRTVLTNRDKTDKGDNNYQNFRAPSEIRHIDITPITITPERVISPGKSIDDLYEKKHRFNYNDYIPISILKTEPLTKGKSSNREPPITKSVEHIVYDQQTETGHSVIAITDKEKIYYSPRAPNSQSESSHTRMDKNFTEIKETENWYSDNGDMIHTQGEDGSKANFRQEGHLHSYYPLSHKARDGHGGGKEEQVYNYSFDDSGFADRSELSLNRSGESSYSSVAKGGKYPSHRVVEAEALNKTFEDLAGTPSVFRARLDLSHFKRHEIEAKVVDDKIVVNAQHGERADPESPRGAVTKREFFTSYTLPPDCDPDKVRAYMSQNGYLTIECVRTRASTRGEYADNVPIHIK